MHTMMESGQTIPEELEEGVKHFSEQLSTLLGQGTSESLNWRKERDVFINSCKKLVGASKEVIEHTDISYEDLASGIAESISSNDFPETLEIKQKHDTPTAAEAEPEQEDEPEEEEEEVAPEVVEEPVEEPKSEPEAQKVEEAEPVADKKPDESETPAATDDSAVAEGEDIRGRGGRGRGRGPRPDRGTRGDRGAIRGERGANRGERGANRGERGAYRGDRGDRGRGGRGRGQNWRGRNGEDNEGFITVKEDGDTRGRGRGRGYRGRGDRGDRGAWRGSNEDGEGNFRGGPRPPRGDRPPRTRANKEGGGDLPGVATAVADPKPVSDIQ